MNHSTSFYLSLILALEVCSTCVSSLGQIADGFKQAKHHGTELKKKKKKRLQEPKDPDRDHYRNVSIQNEWIRGNLFDAMGNYLFFHKCIINALNISLQCLFRQCKVKQYQFQKPLVIMTKNEVDNEKVKSFVFMPESIETSLSLWWANLPNDHTVSVRYPHEKYGLAGKVSNSERLALRSYFLSLLTQ